MVDRTDRTAEEELRRLAALQAFTSALATCTREEETLNTVRAYASVFGAVSGTIGLVRGSQLELREAFGGAEDAAEAWRVIPLETATPLTDSARTGELVLVTSREHMHQEYPLTVGSVPEDGTWIALPLQDAGATLGCVGLRFAPGTAPAQQGLDYLRLLSGQIALSLTRARLLVEVEERSAFERRLLGILSHDLRTPLTAILYSAELAQRTDDDTAHVDRIQRSARRMSAVIEATLDLAGTRERDCEWYDSIAHLVRDDVAELQSAWPGRTIEFVVHEDLPVRCDPALLSQVVTNLVRNALVHGCSETPVRVSTGWNEGCVVEVFNKGLPIPADCIPTLFEPFSRGPSAPVGGVGLGLYIVREYTARMNGTVTVDSGPEGTTFTLRLPTVAGSSAPVSSGFGRTERV